MKKSTSGFTIVELLIVIVVIAILATISIVAYNGMQQRARNAQTVSAVTTYIKALQMYKVDNGQYPPVNSCLGVGYVDNRCDSRAGQYVENGGNLNTTYLAPYFQSSVPSPATNRADYAGFELGGAWYAWNNSLYGGTDNGGIGLYHQGSGNCPSIGGITFKTSDNFVDGSGKWCRYGLDS